MIRLEKNRRGLLLILCIPLLTWGISLLGVFSGVQGVLYDVFIRHAPAFNHQPPQVLLVETDGIAANELNDLYISMLRILGNMEPERIVFLMPPPELELNFYEACAVQGNILFGRLLMFDERTVAEFESSPDFAETLNLPFFYAPLPLNDHGLYRSYPLVVEVKGQSVPTVVGALRPEIVSDSPSELLVDFAGPGESLPRIHGQRVVSGSIVPQMVKNKIILVGPNTLRGSPGFKTPIADSTIIGMGLLTYIGYALNTFASGHIVFIPPLWATPCLVFFITLAGLVLYQYVPTRFSIWVTLVTWGVTLLIGWVGLFIFKVWLPVAALLLSWLLVHLGVERQRLTQQNKAGRRGLLDTSFKLREKVQAKGFADSQEHWTQVIVLVNQVFNMDRIIFLEPLGNGRHVREVVALGCSLEDILEQRRDFGRTPYTKALERGGPIQVSKYFKPTETEEVEYMVPLMFSGLLQGFWAFTLSPERSAMFDRFRSLVNDFADEIAMLLHNKQQWELQQLKEKNLFTRLLSIQAGDNVFQQIEASIGLLVKRMDGLQLTLDTLQTPVLLYDLFGNLLLVNNSMSEILSRSGISPWKMTAIDLAVQLSGVETQDIRRRFGFVVKHKETQRIPLVIQRNEGKHYILYIRPVLGNQGESLDSNPLPFNLYGVLFEIMDVTHIMYYMKFKEEYFDNACYLLKELLKNLDVTCGILNNESTTEDEHQKTMLEVSDILSNLKRHVHQLHGSIDFDVYTESTETLPLNPTTCFTAAMLKLESENPDFIVQERFELLSCSVRAMVYANPDELTMLISSVLAVLGDDLTEVGKIYGIISEEQDAVYMKFSNEGFGLPNDELQGFLFENRQGGAKELGMVAKYLSKLQQWGGTLTAHGEVGHGIEFDIRLPKFTAVISKETE